MIKRVLCSIANLLWILLCQSEHRAFRKSLRAVQQTQAKLLARLIERNKDCAYGREHGFDKINSVADFQTCVPLTRYDDYLPCIERIAGGEGQVLTSEPVIMFELSSGSSAASKYIPYTASLKREFQAAVKPWIYDMYTHIPGLFWGQAYWSITPVANTGKKTAGGVPVGFEEDSEYFGVIERFLLNLLFAVPSEVKQIGHMDAFRYVTLLFLLKARDLRLISVWNPTFITLLFEQFEAWQSDLVHDLEHGTISRYSDEIDGRLMNTLTHKLGRNRRRARALAAIYAQTDLGEKSIYEHIWPCLTLISCWTCANAKAYVPKVRELFPTTRIQGKGLLATEGVISIPLVDQSDYILATRSHFMEFIAQEGDGQARPKLAHELEPGGIYAVVITTGGGFYRYQLHDLVEVTGLMHGCPMIRFMGKQEKVSDHFGEKLNEYHVGTVLEQAFTRQGIAPDFYMLAPDDHDQDGFAYTLYLETGCAKDPRFMAGLGTLAVEIEQGLQENYHYRYCRNLRQLKGLRIFLVEEGSGIETYIRTCQDHGQRMGDTKPAILHARTGWNFPGAYLPVGPGMPEMEQGAATATDPVRAC